jgi:glycosyltransferase involved in cell wall biosynthesis
MKLSIIVPCYNEGKNIPLILNKFNEVIHRKDVEVILVNNGSTDNSAAVLDELIPKFPFARVENVAVNQGYGFGIVSGLKAAKGAFIGYTHADMQTDPGDVLRALALIEQQNDPTKCYVKGDRKRRPMFDQFFTMGMSFFETLYLGVKLWDINAQPNIFHRSFFEGLSNPPKDFSLDLFFLYKAQKQGINIIRFDVVFPPRIHGESSWNTSMGAKWKFIKRTLDFSFKLKKQL